MSKTADSHGTKRARAESGREKAPVARGAFAPALAQRPVSGPPPLPTGGETIQYQVLAIPTMILFRNGQEVKRIQGAMPKKRIEAELEPALA